MSDNAPGFLVNDIDKWLNDTGSGERIRYHLKVREINSLRKMALEHYNKVIDNYILKSTADKQREEILKPIRDFQKKWRGAEEDLPREIIDANNAIRETLEIADKAGK